MGKNIIIQEGGIGKQLTVDKLKTNLVGSGACLWVPEDIVQLTTKTVTENGTYKASDDGSYGYSQVIVNVAGGAGGAPGGPGSSIVGKDNDGDESIVSVDENGDIHSEKVPSSIRVITPPSNPYGIYTNGQSIGTDGMVLKAYLETDGEYGTVPNNEITLNPSVATYDASTDEEGYTEVNGSPFEEIDNLIPFNAAGSSFTLETDKANYNYVQGAGGANIAAFVRGSSGSFSVQMIFASSSPFSFGASVNTYDHSGPPPIPPTPSTQAGSFTYNGKTVYYGYASSSTSGQIVSAGPYNVSNIDVQNFARYIAWSIIYGDTETHKAGSRQTITVSWPRPGDGKVLETTFEILVAPGYTPGGGE